MSAVKHFDHPAIRHSEVSEESEVVRVRFKEKPGALRKICGGKEDDRGVGGRLSAT
jgi:hypothetical protein